VLSRALCSLLYTLLFMVHKTVLQAGKRAVVRWITPPSLVACRPQRGYPWPADATAFLRARRSITKGVALHLSGICMLSYWSPEP